MSIARIFTRLPITATRRTTPTLARFNSSTSTSSASAARIVEIARAAEKPSPVEAALPVVWAVTGGLAVLAWNRAAERKEDSVEKLLVV